MFFHAWNRSKRTSIALSLSPSLPARGPLSRADEKEEEERRRGGVRMRGGGGGTALD